MAHRIQYVLKSSNFREYFSFVARAYVWTKYGTILFYSSGSVVVKYRIGWEYKDDNEPQDLIDAETLKTRLDMHLREHDGFLYNYRVPVSRLRSDCK